MCALTMLQVTDVSAAEIAKGDVITIESIKTSTDKVASNYSTNSDMLLSSMVPTSKRSNVIHEDDLVITETEITYQQLFPTSLTSSMISAQAKAAGYKTGFSFHIYEVSSS